VSLTWVICGAGRRIGKTGLARQLCELLPNATYAKQDSGARQERKTPNFFPSDQELASFIAAARAQHEHLVVESNGLARRGDGDIIIFVDGPAEQTEARPDVDLLRAKSHVQIAAAVEPGEWREVLQQKLRSPALCNAVCELFARHAERAQTPETAVRQVTPLRFSSPASPPVPDPGYVAVEELLTVMIDGVGNFALLCTPCDVEALAIGFAFSEGLIASMDDVHGCTYRPDQQSIALRLDPPPHGPTGRNLIVTSSCGLCGSRNIERLLAGSTVCGDRLRLALPVLHAAAAEMRARQRCFARTGGTHAAGIFTAAGEMLAMGEDIGRHNAFDKATGQCLLRDLPLVGRAAILSGRVSVELIAKAARAGLELVAAVSAPSDLAIRVAQRCRITLCGFVREGRATVYTHPHRIIGGDDFRVDEQAGGL
jgi:FdhD protein